MSKEVLLKLPSSRYPCARDMLGTAEQIMEFAKSSTVIRSFNANYGLTGDLFAYESDGAHTNFMSAILDRALVYYYGVNFELTCDGYTYREVMEAARRHDLPENVTGDIPDNGDRDESAKLREEGIYQRHFSEKSMAKERETERHILSLIAEMDAKTTISGRMIYLADKLSAVLYCLFLDSIQLSPVYSLNNPRLSVRDRYEMALCENHTASGDYYASEMWTVDFLKAREMSRHDDTGFFTALLVMMTLLIKGRWYAWRERDYQDLFS